MFPLEGWASWPWNCQTVELIWHGGKLWSLTFAIASFAGHSLLRLTNLLCLTENDAFNCSDREGSAENGLHHLSALQIHVCTLSFH